jgi:hypothetical protein
MLFRLVIFYCYLSSVKIPLGHNAFFVAMDVIALNWVIIVYTNDFVPKKWFVGCSDKLFLQVITPYSLIVSLKRRHLLHFR